MTAQLSLLDVLCPPQPDYLFGHCACGWLLAGWHISAVDQPGWRAVRHLWLWVPDNPGAARTADARPSAQ